MRNRTYKELRCKMYADGIQQIDIAKHIKKCLTYVNVRLSGEKPWTLDDVYGICDFLEIPYSDISLYFPKGGS